MQAFMHRVRRLMGRSVFAGDERGLSTVEYVILLVIVAVLAIGTWAKLGNKVRKQIEDSAVEIEGLPQQTGEDSSGI